MATYARIEKNTLYLGGSTLPLDDVATNLVKVQPMPNQRGRGCGELVASFFTFSSVFLIYMMIFGFNRPGGVIPNEVPLIGVLIALVASVVAFVLSMKATAPKMPQPYFELSFHAGSMPPVKLLSFNPDELVRFQAAVMQAKGTRETINIGRIEANLTYGNQFNGPAQVHGYNNNQRF